MSFTLLGHHDCKNCVASPAISSLLSPTLYASSKAPLLQLSRAEVQLPHSPLLSTPFLMLHSFLHYHTFYPEQLQLNVPRSSYSQRLDRMGVCNAVIVAGAYGIGRGMDRCGGVYRKGI
ncbi:hypothetical protein BU23DRAFT_231535 [Bimuria novae-zelandiae CBS 107.79]|uniref:Uncharacterized protein n=1 Tax=Bimuria novae-zelandiae CBS 107.79 TaxID=1447943 RepID=A0A6A5UZK1_9PLEO|nr:hypothetical protein BU23DRAFT_231535 [Bimuria novae-zelandiae CBS 107.79]